jgi:hypothetical protein
VFDSPAAMRAMLCHFRSCGSRGRWQVLARAADRCGAPAEIDEVTARFGEAIPIPDPPDSRSAVVAEVDGVQVDGLERFVTIVYRSELRAIKFDGARDYRLVSGTASDGLVHSVPGARDIPTAFAPANLPAESISLIKGAGPKAADGEVTVRFLSMPIR